MTDTTLPPGYLGPSTEARFAAAFAHKAVLGAQQAADLIGVDVKTIPDLPIRSVPKGAKHRGYTELALRQYLLEETEAACKPAVVTTGTTKPKARAFGSNVQVVNFSERRRKR